LQFKIGPYFLKRVRILKKARPSLFSEGRATTTLNYLENHFLVFAVAQVHVVVVIIQRHKIACIEPFLKTNQ